MRLDIVEIAYTNTVGVILKNRASNRYIANLCGKHGMENAEFIKMCTDLYQDIHEAGILNKVLDALDKRKAQSNEQ